MKTKTNVLDYSELEQIFTSLLHVNKNERR